MNTIHTPFRIALLAAFFILHPSSFILAQGGPLTPPGAPAPTMKTLDQIEPRIDVTTLAGDANNEYIIGQAGSFYLSRNVLTSKTTCISIASSGVTLDLGGFQIARLGGSGGNGIFVNVGGNRATIRNGTIAGSFAQGINCDASSTVTRIEELAISNCTSIGILARTGAIIRQCRVHDQTGGGIQAGPSATISHCVISSCQSGRGILGLFATTIDYCSVTAQTGFAGIDVQSGGVITNCAVHNSTVTFAALRSETGTTIAHSTAYLNNTPAGIACGNGSTISHCAARSNTNASASSCGISASFGSTITECSADSNLSTAVTLTGLTGGGIATFGEVSVFNCTARNNVGDGIRVNSGCVVRGNTCAVNGNVVGDAAGIQATGSDNRIEGNTVTNNDRGIDVDVLGNFIVRNTASGNTSNYEIAANNAVGTIVSTLNSGVISGSTGGSGVGSTDPWANFSF